MQIPLIKGDKIENDGRVDYKDALPINMFAVLHRIKNSQGYMYQEYGLEKIGEGSGVSRGARWVSNADLAGEYRVLGTEFVRMKYDGTYDVLGVISGTGQCSIAYSFLNIAVAGGGKLYYYNPTDGLREISGVGDNPDSCIDVVWSDNVFIATDGEFVFHSSFSDEEVFLPVDFDNASFRPDPTFGLGVNKDSEILAFGKNSTQYYTFRALENFAFIPNRNKNVETGISGVHAKVKFFDKWYCVGRREESRFGIYIIRGGDSRDISTREVKKILAKYSNLESVTVDAMEKDGIKLVRFHLPSETLTLNVNVLESEMGNAYAWCISKTGPEQSTTNYRAKDFVYSELFNDWTVGDKQDGTIGTVSDLVATHYGEISEWVLTTPLLNLETLSVDELRIEGISGFSIDEDSTVAISASDEGLIYSNEYWYLYSENQVYTTRFIVRRLGAVRYKWISYKFRGASRSRMNFAYLNLEAS